VATINSDGKLKAEMVVKMNKGYVPSERNKNEKDLSA
jgi:DNA-directed RNA polymerase alpha subunit